MSSMGKILIVSVFVLLVEACGSGGESRQIDVPGETLAPGAAPSTTTTVPVSIDLASVQVVSETRHSEDETLVLGISVPQLRGLADSAVQDAVNERLAVDVSKLLADFAREAEQDGGAKAHKSEVHVSYEVTLLQHGLFSVTVTTSTYSSGAAHGFTGIDGYIFDLVSGTLLGVDDITNDPEGLAFLARRDIVDQVYGGNESMAGDFVPSNAHDLLDAATFALTQDGLEALFDQYAVAAGAVGVVAVRFPFTQLQSSIPPTSPLARLMGTP